MMIMIVVVMMVMMTTTTTMMMMIMKMTKCFHLVKDFYPLCSLVRSCLK